MMISPSSRYANATTTVITDTEGASRQTIIQQSPSSQSLTVVNYSWGATDRIDLLAALAYGDETMWWVIANANPEILDWTQITPGTVVRVPNGVG